MNKTRSNSRSFECHIFADFGAGYTQIVDDYTHRILEDSLRFVKDKQQLIIHRDGNKIYYIYIMTLNTKGHFVGYCIQTYNEYFKNPTDVFSGMDAVIVEMAKKGIFCKFNKDLKEISGNNVKFNKFIGEAYDLLHSVEDFVKRQSGRLIRLPNRDETMFRDAVLEFSYLDDRAKIRESSCRYPYTVVYKNEQFKLGYLNSIARIIEEYKIEIKNRDKEIKKLRAELDDRKILQKPFNWKLFFSNIKRVWYKYYWWIFGVIIIFILIDLIMIFYTSD